MNHPFNKWVNKLGRQFSKEERQMANKLFENCSISFAIMEMAKLFLRFQHTPLRMVPSKGKKTTKAGGSVGKKSFTHC